MTVNEIEKTGFALPFGILISESNDSRKQRIDFNSRVSVLCVTQITRQGISYTADSFITIVEQTLIVRLMPESDVIVGK